LPSSHRRRPLPALRSSRQHNQQVGIGLNADDENQVDLPAERLVVPPDAVYM
jgi:hypothetical protein